MVVNKLDQVCGIGSHCLDDDDQLDVESVVEKVHSYICKICSCTDIPKEVIVPVYGKWAHMARYLEKHPECPERKESVVRTLASFSSQPAGQGESTASFLHRKSVEELVEELEKHSNVRQLEER